MRGGRMIYFLLIFLITGLPALNGSTHCKIVGECKAQCDETILDLSDALHKFLPLQISDFASGNKSEESLFFIDPCQGYACGNEGPQSAVCRETHDGNLISCGLLNQTKWYLETDDPSYRYMLIFTEGHSNRASSITFIEDPSVDELNSTYIGQNPSDYYNFQVTSRCIRPGVCIKKQSVKNPIGIIGFVFITFFIVGFLLYMSMGTFVMYCRGARGQELIPNVGFWKDLPHLIAEGCLFAIAPCYCCQKKQLTVYEELPNMR